MLVLDVKLGFDVHTVGETSWVATVHTFTMAVRAGSSGSNAHDRVRFECSARCLTAAPTLLGCVGCEVLRGW